ncbi:conserved hypothetical protein [Burkholderia ambifaria MC40-6]|uniref:DUF4148 domain-containing protein n=1 Tax=Burkholderia ambifaria (strain MC40-6) TaxID=398577 RepID=B1Z4B4_BURA4|nr:DUF4148 domain-containing protein [Burkholderia ambifaria]ACB68577.1 conserved hypothetical protein [Burkholderia ambifaria MC40-6]
MKSHSIVAMLVALSAYVATPAFASESTVTREQVRAELAALQKAGYSPSRPNDPHYPDNLQAALNRVRDNSGSATERQASSNNSDYGKSSGRDAVTRTAEHSTYFGH